MFRLVILAMLAVSAVGCGRSSPHVHGRVTVDGQPVARGIIRFEPEAKTDSSNAAAPIQDGMYELPAGNSLRPGKFKVLLQVPRKTGKKVKMPSVPMGVVAKEDEEEVESIPARYNTRTELHVEITGGDQTENFDIVVANKK